MYSVCSKIEKDVGKNYLFEGQGQNLGEIGEIMIKRYILMIILIFLLVSCGRIPQFGTAERMNSRHEIVLVYVDAKSEEVLGRFPWGRDIHARLIRKIEEFEPLVLAMKFIYLEKDSLHPEKDEALIQTIKSYKNIFLECAAFEEDGPKRDYSSLIKLKGEKPEDIAQYSYAELPFEELGKHSAGIGFVNAFTNKKREFLGYQLVVGLKDKIYPSLPLLIFTSVLGVDSSEIKVKKGEIMVGKIHLPLNPDGSFPILLSKPGELYKNYSFVNILSFVDVLNGKVSGSKFRGKIVIVGYGGENFPVKFKTQFGEKIGTEIVADALNTLFIYAERGK